MTAAGALTAALAAGIELRLDGGDLVLAADAQPPEAVLDVLAHHKAGIVTMLQPDRDGWTAEDWRVFFDERAGIAEFDGGLPRVAAEVQASACLIAEQQRRAEPQGEPHDDTAEAL